MRLAPSENELHASIADLLDWALLPPAMWTTFPAGWGRLGRATAGWLKKCGLKEGMPDILIFYNSKCFGIELKVGKNRQTTVQREMQDRLTLAGVPVAVCRSLDDVLCRLAVWQLPHRQMQFTGGGSEQWPRSAANRASGRSSSEPQSRIS